MWVIVAFSLAVSGDSPKLKILPGKEFASEAECVKAVHARASFDSEGGGIEFTVCMPKDSIEIGRVEADKSTDNKD